MSVLRAGVFSKWGGLGAVLGRLGAVLGPFWGVLGPSWGVLGPSWVVLGGQVEKSLRAHIYFGLFLVPFWYIFGGLGRSGNDFERHKDKRRQEKPIRP